ncbi:hypothetical protein GR157_31775 [Burkholderia sp. 4701]|nr:hypothetical protein [Burkholderia sp. 4701]MXN86498.1 hypothetical protein [Burkholderia sp. 4812]
MGIPFPPVLGSAANALAQAIPVPVPTPAPSAGAPSGSGAGAGADGGWGALPRDRSREREQSCKCPPEKNGKRLKPPHGVTGLSAEYQQYVTGFPMGIEFFFSEKWFDGFMPQQCLFQEAKANYDFFFDKSGQAKFFFFHGKGPKNPDPAKSIPAYKSIMQEAETQSAVVVSNPPSRLRWYFMQNLFYRWATKEFSKEMLPISTEFKPMV